MAGITARSTRGRLQDDSKDLRHPSYVTAQPTTSNRTALDTIPIAFALIDSDVVVESGSNASIVNVTGHAFKRGDLLILKTTTNAIKENLVTIDETSTNSFELATVLSANLTAGDTFDLYRPTVLQVDSSGKLIVNNDKPLRFIRGTEVVDVYKDLVDTNNSRPLPVEIIGAGVSLTIDGSTLELSLSHTGVDYSSVRIGNGTYLWDIDSTGHGLVKDAAVATAIAGLLTELEKKADLTETQPVSLASAPLPSGAATSANQSTIITAIAGLLTELEKKADLTETQPVSLASAPLPSGAATSANQVTTNSSLDTIISRLPSSLGTKTAANSFPVTLPSDSIVTINRLNVVDMLDNLMVTSIPASSGTPLIVVDSLAANVKKIKVIDDISEFIGLYDGSNTLLCILPMGYTGGELEIFIAQGTSLKLRNMKDAAITQGSIAINFLGDGTDFSPPAPAVDDFMLQENGDLLLQENGDKIVI